MVAHVTTDCFSGYLRYPAATKDQEYLKNTSVGPALSTAEEVVSQGFEVLLVELTTLH